MAGIYALTFTNSLCPLYGFHMFRSYTAIISLNAIDDLVFVVVTRYIFF
jgi:hypothetical protein